MLQPRNLPTKMTAYMSAIHAEHNSWMFHSILSIGGSGGRACDYDYSLSRHTPNVADLAIVSRYVISISDAGHNSAILPGITIVTTSHNVDIPAQLLQCSASTCSSEHGEVLVHVVFGLRLGGCAYWEGL